MVQLAPIRLKAPSILQTGQEMSGNSDTKQRLLIVDDSKVIRVTARKILQQQFETVEAVDGENAWEILTGMGPFSLVVSDLTMPKLDGYGLLEKIRAAHDPDICNLPVIVITGDNDSEKTMRKAREAGATDFIGKPFDSVHLLACAQSHASAHARHQSLTEQNIALEDQALTDIQTGLANEKAFMERGQQQLSYASRHDTTLTVAQVEIDNYGELFRQHGEPVTGMLVKYAATVLQSGIRQEDMAARTGTARFSMLLTGMERNGVRALTDRICKDISERVIRYGSEEVRFTVSIGICSPEIQQDSNFDDLLTIAGNNLQQAITMGGDRTVYENTADASPPPTEYLATEETVADDTPGQAIDEDFSPMAVEETAAGGIVTAMDDVSVAEMLVNTVAQPAANYEASMPETAQQSCVAEAEAGIEAETEAETEAEIATETEAETGAAETATEEQLPEMFAEPVSGVSKKLASKVAKAKKLAAASETEIVITAPYGEFNNQTTADSQPEQPGTSTPAQETTTSPQQAEQSAARPEAVMSEHTSARRPGFFSRIFALFSRSGK
jgi:diguanylate cyclase (GGDEF)-like protein